MSRRTSLFVTFAVAALASACGSSSSTGTISSPLSQWCVDPPRDTMGNTALTLVAKPGQSLGSHIAVHFNDQTAVDFMDDGTGGDTTAGDGIFTHSATLDTAPTSHVCNPVNEGPAPSLEPNDLGDEGSVEQEIGGTLECHTVPCPPGCKSILGFDCVVCVSCSGSIKFETGSN